MNSVLIHFDVEDHYVLLETFIASAASAKKVVDAFNEEYFGGRLDFEVVILPPEKGSLKQYVGVFLKNGGKLAECAGWTLGALWMLANVMDSETVQEISKEFLGGKPSEILIENLRNLEEYLRSTDASYPELYDEGGQGEYVVTADLVEKVVTRSVVDALQMPRASLERLDVTQQLRFELLEAQSQLYGQALSDPKVKGIGFQEESEFPVPRSNFAERAIVPRRKELEDKEELQWEVSIRRIKVLSPNFEQETQHIRKWKGRDAAGQPLLFEVVDERFWFLWRRSEVKFTETTEMLVQLATLEQGGRRKVHNVIRVLSIGGEKLAPPLEGNALEAILGSFSLRSDNFKEPGLFDDE